MTKALKAVIGRLDRTLAESDGRFPMYADATTGAWQWSADGSWFGGFWPGMLWLAAAATGESGYARQAEAASRRLRPRADSPTLLRGFLFWYGDAVGTVLGQPGGETASNAARALAADADPVAGLLPPGEEDAHSYDWPRPGISIDGLPGTVPLLDFAADRTADPALRALAAGHARAAARLCVRDDGSVAQTATYDATGHLTQRVAANGSSQDSTWSRAQAWAMLGFAQAARRFPEFGPVAEQVADWFLAHLGPARVCYWDFDDPAIPDAPLDTSATAIAAAALFKLPNERHHGAADHILDALTADHLNRHGGLIDGCYNRIKRLATSNELIWGDYFLLEALLARQGHPATPQL